LSCGGERPCETCVVEDRHNFRYASQLDVAQATLAQSQDATVSWEGLSADLRGRPLDPVSNPGEAVLLWFPLLEHEAIVQHIANDSLTQDAIGAYFFCRPDEPRCALSSFCLDHTCLEPAQYFEAERGSFLVTLRDGVDQQALAFLFLAPDPASDETLAVIGDSATALEVQVDLEGVDPLEVGPGADLELDWGGLSRDGLGNPLALHRLDALELAHFAAEPAALEADFLLLDELTAERWSMDVEGLISASLAGFEGFDGIDDQGTWLLALRCSSCQSPIPKVIVRLVPG